MDNKIVVDWSKKQGVIGPTVQKGHVCWAYATIASIEAMNQISTKSKTFKQLSVQHLVDCYDCYDETKDITYTWGKPNRAFDYIVSRNNGHVYSEEEYPIRGDQPTRGVCSLKGKTPAVTIDGYNGVLCNEKVLEEVVRCHPVTANIASSVISLCKKDMIIRYHEVDGDKKPDHNVLIVGYGTELGVDYWKVKSFWHPEKFGDEGYFRIERTTNNPNRHPKGYGAAGIARACYYPLKKGFNS